MGERVAFDVEAMTVLSRELREAASQAFAICRSVAELEQRAGELGAPPPASGGPTHGSSDPTAVRGLRRIVAEAPTMADEIDRRTEHLASVESAAGLGYQIERRLWFADDAPVRLDRVDEAVAAVAARFAAPERIRRDDYPALRRMLEELTPAERQAVIGGIGLATIAAIGGDLSRRRGHGGRGNPRTDPLDPDDLRELLGLLLSSAPSALAGRLAADVPVAEPAFGEVALFDREVFGVRGWSTGLYYQPSGGSIVDGGVSAADVRQRALGDCWFVAGLLAVAGQRPQLIEENLRDNGNGTVTVTFYRDGAPVPVTVTTAVPYAPRVAWHPFAADGPPEEIAETWGPLYEKAFAQLHGGYAAIEKGGVDEALPQLTGRPAARSQPGDISAGRLRALLEAGYAVTASTGFEMFGVFGVAPGPLAARHVYAVTAVEPDATDASVRPEATVRPEAADATVVLRDPRYPGEDSLTRLPWSTLQKHLDYLAWVPTR
jgi:hypothetical protein